MKNLLVTTAFLFIYFGFASITKAQDFSGTWKAETDDVSFTLEIKQKGKDVSGTYSYVVLPDATRIRAGKFTGRISGDIARINFQNDEYETEKGIAMIQLVTETLVWKMDEEIAEILKIPANFDLEKVEKK